MKKMRFVDLSIDLVQFPPPLGAQIEYIDHKGGVSDMLTAFPGITEDDLPGGLGWATEHLTLHTHMGTHIDAPYHFHPTAGNEPSKTIDEMPLEYAYGNGVVLDMRHIAPRTVITVQDVKDALDKINYKIQPLDIVLIMTGADRYLNQNEILKYVYEYAGMGREATLWLLDQGVKVVGTDAIGWDRPFDSQAEDFRKTGDRSLIWEGHYAGIEKEYFQMEKLTNLDKLPPYGFTVCCFPVKIRKASAAWLRPVAIIFE